MSDQYLAIRLESDLIPGSAKVVGLEGTESISQPFQFNVRFYSPDGALLDGQVLIGQAATIAFERGGRTLRRVHGMFSEVYDFGVTGSGNNAWRATFVPRAWSLEQNYKTDVFLYMTVPEIITEVFRRSGYELDEDFQFRLNYRYHRREFTVQYRETDLAFISRLCEHLGIFFFFEHDSGKDVMVFADHNEAFKPVPDAESVEWVERDTVTGVQAFEMVTRMIPTAYTVKDYNYRTPTTTLSAERAIEKDGGGGTVYEHGDNFKSPEEASLIATVRSEEVRCRRNNFEGRSNVPQMITGATFTLENHPRGDFPLLLTTINHNYSAGTSQEAQADNAATAYHNDWVALTKSTSYRPPRVTPRPRVFGLITAFIEDVSSENPYAMLDEQGRYRVRFVFDRTAQPAGRATHAIRMAQPHVGVGYGLHFPLRNGREVVISCIDGDPDRPIIVGGVPNPSTVTPSSSPNHFENRLRSGGGNELRMNDTVSAQRVIIESPHLKSLIQLGHKEHPEFGFYSSTEGHETHVAQRSQNYVAPTSRDMVDHKGVYASRSLIMTAGISLPGVALGQNALQFEGLLDTVRDALVDARDTLGGLDGRKYHALNQQLDDAKVRRDDALDDVVTNHPELDKEDDSAATADDGASNDNAQSGSGDASTSGGAAAGSGSASSSSSSSSSASSSSSSSSSSNSISDRIRSTRDAELAALGMVNGVVQEAHEKLGDFAKRVDSLRRKPLFGKEKHVAKALDQIAKTVQKADKVVTQASATIDKVESTSKQVADEAIKAVDAVQGAVEGVSHAKPKEIVDAVEQLDLSQFKKPKRNEGESEAAYRRRVAQAYANATLSLMEKMAHQGHAADPNSPCACSSPDISQQEATAVGAALAKQAEKSDSGGSGAPESGGDEEAKKESLKRYERAANQSDRIRNRMAEYWDALKNRPQSLFRDTAHKLLDELEKRGEGEWGWGDLGTVYSVVSDSLQRSRLGALLQNAEHVATTSASRMPREQDDILRHTDDTDGALIQSARKIAALVGEDAVLAAERAATLTARGAVNVVAGGNAYIHASSTAEISAQSAVALSANNHVDILADDHVSIIAHPRGAERGTDEEAVPHFHTMMLRSRKSVLVDSVRGSIHIQALEPRPSDSEPEDKEKGDVTVEAGHEIHATAKKLITVTSAEEDIIVTAVKQKVRLHALEEAMMLTSKKDWTAQSDATLALKADAVTSNSAKDTSVKAGQKVNVEGGSSINLQAPTINVRGKLYLG